ncbi:MAG: DUF3137 domain-containing protein [Bacteroidia bacterium]
MALLDVFRPHKRLIWKQFAARHAADFVPGRGLLDHDVIKVQHGNWTIYFDTFKRGKRRFTRIRAPYVNRDSFRFHIHRASFLSGIGKSFGMQDVIVGHPDFDKAFIIQGNSEEKLRQFFDNDLIRSLLSYQPAGSLEVHLDKTWSQDPFSEGQSELYFEVPVIVDSLQQLEDLYNLFAEVLDQLCGIGSAYDDEPG